MQRVAPPKFFLTFFCILFLCLTHSSPIQAKSLRRFPCDPKFGYEGNYIEITTGDIATAKDMDICFAQTVDPVVGTTANWWEFWKKEPKKEAVVFTGKDRCLSTADLPGRYKMSDGRWTDWEKAVSLDRNGATFQFALCGEKDDISLWENFHQYNGTDSWDTIWLEYSGKGTVMVESIRIVQNRVRILDNERDDEGHVRTLLQGKAGESSQLDLAARIKRSKLNRLNCLNLESGPPYCEQGVPGLQNNAVPGVIQAALLELGHSGSVKYGRKNSSYCSEFSYYVIEKSVKLSDTCKWFIPDPSRENVNVKDMFRWFKSCKRLIPRDLIREQIKPGDFLSVDNYKHSVIFLGWTDSTKTFFWEISGNNKCKTERETFYAPKNKANMVCISKRNFDQDVTARDFGGIVH